MPEARLKVVISGPAGCCAVLRFDAGPELPALEDLKDPVVRAVTRWVRNDANGLIAFRVAQHRFTVADLADHLDDRHLRAYLAQEGIRALAVEAHEEDPCPGWQFHDPLADCAELAREATS